MGGVAITTVIPWRQRLELAETLRHNGPLLAAMGADVIVVNCGGDRRLLQQLLGSSERVSTRQVDLPGCRFNRALALNIGVHEARPGIVFTLDADILLTESLAVHAETCARRHCFAVSAGMVSVPAKEPLFEPPPGSCLQRIVHVNTHFYHWTDGTVTTLVRDRLDYGSRRALAPGIMFARREHVVAVGGYRSDLVGWGWEDLDLQVRLLRSGLDCMHVDEEIRHLDHGDDQRDLDGPKLEVGTANRLRVWRSFCTGTFTGTYRRDVAAWRGAQTAISEEPEDSPVPLAVTPTNETTIPRIRD